MSFEDNRKFISALSRTGDLVEISKEVDWDMEAGAILRYASKIQAPAPLFKKIKDYPGNFTIFGLPINSIRRTSIALGLEPQKPLRAIQNEYEKRIDNHIKPVLLKSGPCKENILLGDDVDLFNFPVPLIHQGDGGRYIGTWHLVINKDPESDWTNWGLYRVMVYNRRTCAILLHHGNHGGAIFTEKYLPLKKPMPVAIAIGADPICIWMASAPIPRGKSEVDYAGALHQKPVELVKCETCDLLVPAHSEIVLEGEVLPDQLIPEGPFAEFTGYRTGLDMLHVCKINAITFRNKPILTVENPNTELSSGLTYRAVSMSVNIKKHLLGHGLPILDVTVPSQTALLMILVSVKQNHSSTVCTQIGNTIFSDNIPPSTVMVLDDDVDIFNIDEVLHAFATKCHPGKGIKIREEEYVSGLAPYLNQKERQQRKESKLLLDCTWPVEWIQKNEAPTRAIFEDLYPAELRQKIISHWSDYGYKKTSS